MSRLISIIRFKYPYQLRITTANNNELVDKIFAVSKSNRFDIRIYCNDFDNFDSNLCKK